MDKSQIDVLFDEFLSLDLDQQSNAFAIMFGVLDATFDKSDSISKTEVLNALTYAFERQKTHN